MEQFGSTGARSSTARRRVHRARLRRVGAALAVGAALLLPASADALGIEI